MCVEEGRWESPPISTYVDMRWGLLCSMHLCTCAFHLWVSGRGGIYMLLYFWVYLGECVGTYMRIQVSAQWLYGTLCTQCVCVCCNWVVCPYVRVSGFPRPGTSPRSAWTTVLKGLRETGAAITLNHSFASLASAPVEKCFKKQNK